MAGAILRSTAAKAVGFTLAASAPSGSACWAVTPTHHPNLQVQDSVAPLDSVKIEFRIHGLNNS
jgi:hypothetical protein